MTLTAQLQNQAEELLRGGRASCVIGYEVGPRGQTRPAFIREAEDAQRLVWNSSCTHNLTRYLGEQLNKQDGDEYIAPVAIVAKPCDSRTLNVMLSENRLLRDQIIVLGVACEGIRENTASTRLNSDGLQARCRRCSEQIPVIYDFLIGEPGNSLIGGDPQPGRGSPDDPDPRAANDGQNVTAAAVSAYMAIDLAEIEKLSPEKRTQFWLEAFDRCIRCYACRQVCPICDCPTCLYERDDSLWVGMGIRLGEKRTFHLGRAFHLAGRCVGCDECERVCPMGIPISLLNRKLALELEETYGFQTGRSPEPSPLTLALDELNTKGGGR
jgi:formate dehydrogenase (coenzyme F420) beta subunit